MQRVEVLNPDMIKFHFFPILRDVQVFLEKICAANYKCADPWVCPGSSDGHAGRPVLRAKRALARSNFIFQPMSRALRELTLSANVLYESLFHQTHKAPPQNFSFCAVAHFGPKWADPVVRTGKRAGPKACTLVVCYANLFSLALQIFLGKNLHMALLAFSGF